jgi:membrane-bound metal-dependent hydrolase YbcI (DUF457 family)
MLAAHLVPGYIVTAQTQKDWSPKWGKTQRALLWVVGLGSTFAPDLDVLYNALFRGFFNHSTLWTHSVFVYLGFGLVWLVLYSLNCWRYMKTAVGLIAVGGLSHLLLDAVAHGTPLLYPVSMVYVSIAPERVVEGGVWAYLTDPIFILEPFLFGVAFLHWIRRREIPPTRKTRISWWVVSGLMVFAVVFALALPRLQKVVTPMLSN